MSAIYLYLDAPSFTAAHHLLNFTALGRITELTSTFNAGADCIRVDLTTPRPSTGERILWQLLTQLSHGHVDLNIDEARDILDGDNWDAVTVALGLINGRGQVSA